MQGFNKGAQQKFTVRFSSKYDWKSGDILGNYDSTIFTDGSKMQCGVGAGIFSKTLNIAVSYRLTHKFSVFQKEMLAISKVCCEILTLAMSDYFYEKYNFLLVTLCLEKLMSWLSVQRLMLLSFRSRNTEI